MYKNIALKFYESDPLKFLSHLLSAIQFYLCKSRQRHFGGNPKKMMSNEMAKLMFHNNPQFYFLYFDTKFKRNAKEKNQHIIIRLESKHWWISRGYLDVLPTIKIFFSLFSSFTF